MLSHLLTRAADRYADRVAVVDARATLLYQDLETRSNQLAHVLRGEGVRRGDRVGLFINKSIDAIVGIYAILKAGAAYVPLDPSAPASRLAYLANDCQIRCLVTGIEKAAAWRELVNGGAPLEVLCVINGSAPEADMLPPGVRQITQETLATAPQTTVPMDAIGQDLAYILYTSGSTGHPKGVMLSHANALAFVNWCHRYFSPTSDDVFSNHAPFHFDLTILDIYTAAMAGARLIVIPPETSVFPRSLTALVEDQGITIWYSVPSALTMMLLHGGLAPGKLATLRHVIFAGEVFPTKHLRRLMEQLPFARFTNLFGPTETNVCTYYPVPSLPLDETDLIPIGRAIDDVDVFAVDDQGHPVNIGEVGELVVRGATVAYGYWGDSERTSRAFVANPVGPAPDRVYRTGDLVRQRADGEFVFLGRRDHQIKTRGYRVELGEVEAAIHAHPDVVECAVLAVPDEMVGNRLHAYVVLRAQQPTATDLAQFCAHVIPKYMIPETFAILPALPKTSTGKIDRHSLRSARGYPQPLAEAEVTVQGTAVT